MARSETHTRPSDRRVTSRYFDTVSTPSGAPIDYNTAFNSTPIPKTPPRKRPLPRAQLEVVIPPYRPKRKPALPPAAEDLPNALRNMPDLSKFAYAPPKTPHRQNTALDLVVPQRDSTVSRFFATNPTGVQRALAPTPLHHHPKPKGSGAVGEPSAPTKKGPRKRKASSSVSTDLNNEKKVKLDICTSLVADNPWKLIIAVSLLNKTRGALSIPVFWEIMDKWPTPEALAIASSDELSQVMAGLGLQNTRANRFIQLSLQYITDPPNRDCLHRSRCPTQTPKKRTPKKVVSFNTTTEIAPPLANGQRQKSVVPQAGESISDPAVEPQVRYPPTPISHLPGVGRYALDSYRIFSPTLSGGGAPQDEQACLQNLLSPNYNSNEAEPEWKKVLPEDKELQKYLVNLALGTRRSTLGARKRIKWSTEAQRPVELTTLVLTDL
ncbi:hypothetical protein FS837_002292 [Tulasnella sp. UAMH 9824]|nr:hypothetical protein FS837_002292 [Tulasnella sp. UAMH 9824]